MRFRKTGENATTETTQQSSEISESELPSKKESLNLFRLFLETAEVMAQSIERLDCIERQVIRIPRFISDGRAFPTNCCRAIGF
jgi:hypothetical protein